jgi:hypothetical protein
LSESSWNILEYNPSFSRAGDGGIGNTSRHGLGGGGGGLKVQGKVPERETGSQGEGYGGGGWWDRAAMPGIAIIAVN